MYATDAGPTVYKKRIPRGRMGQQTRGLFEEMTVTKMMSLCFVGALIAVFGL